MGADNDLEQKNRAHGIKRVRVETPESYAKRLAKQKAARAAKKAAKKATSPAFLALQAAGAENTEESCLTYYRLYQGTNLIGLRPENWLEKPAPYPGRESVDVEALGATWFPLMREYLRSRVAKGMETDKSVRAALHMLCDYLFLYLPWWSELHPGAQFVVPSAPKDFTRFLFVSRSDLAAQRLQSTEELLPATFLELLPLRRNTPDTWNDIVVHAERFFQYVIAAYADDATVAGPRMANPFQLYFDKQKSSKPTKTNKVAFSELVYPHLVYYGQAVEAFGEYLQQREYEEGVVTRLGRDRPNGYDCEEWGYMTFVCYRGSVYPVRWVPGVFYAPKRTFHGNPEGKAGIYVGGRKINAGPNTKRSCRMPNLTTLRQLMGLVETGLRAQGMQWLDLEKWDSANPHPHDILELYTSQPPEMFTKLYVNTDKSKDKPWTTYIPWRLRRSLLAEQYFQQSVSDEFVGIAVPYEERANSRFAPVVPLFRSSHNASPYHDGTYSTYWKYFLLGFQIYFNSRVGYSSRTPTGAPVMMPEPEDFFVLVNNFDEETGEVIVVEGEDGPYCAIAWHAVNSPHACRVTYATLRNGDMEVSEIAQQLGHSNDVTTSIYQVPSERRLRNKLEQFERAHLQYDFDGSSEGFLHPDSPDSTLRQAFANNRDAAIDAFGFVNGVSFWDTSELNSDEDDALELLRKSPASVIKWHPTHVCPVGNQCPADIVPKIGGFQRCGLCPLAAKCVDHLPGIGAKKNELHEAIRISAHRIAGLEEKGKKDGMTDQLHRQMELDAKELMGWELAEQILHDQVAKLGSQPAIYHADAPELIRRHLERVVRNRNESEFFLQRISEPNAYPSMETPEIRARAARYIRVILAKAGRLEEAATAEIEPFEELRAFASLVKPMADAKGFSLEDLATALKPATQFPVIGSGRPRETEWSRARKEQGGSPISTRNSKSKSLEKAGVRRERIQWFER
jgi:hypothetical protein